MALTHSSQLCNISIHSERNPNVPLIVDDSIEGVLIISVSHSVVNQCLKLFFRIVFFPTIRYVLYAQSKPLMPQNRIYQFQLQGLLPLEKSALLCLRAVVSLSYVFLWFPHLGIFV